MNDLPNSWVQTRLADVCRVASGYGFPERLQGKREGELPFYKVGDISETWKRGESLLGRAEHYLNRDEANELRATPFPPGSTVLAKIGAAIGLNRRAMLSVPSLVDNNVMALVPDPGVINPKYLFHFSCTLRLMEYAQATTVPSVRKSDIEEISIPIAPGHEQNRIVDEIEKQFTRLDAATAALKRVQANLKRYRASVLKAACEGRLVPTEAELARNEGRDYEPAGQLLQRILRERRARWEADTLAKMIASGKPPKDDRWKQKYKEPISPDLAKLPPLPEGWCWATFEQVTQIQGGIQKQPSRRPQKNVFPFLRVANVLRARLDLSEIHQIELFDGELERLRLETGDLLIVEGNGSPTEIGRMAIWEGQIPDCVHQNHIIRARPLPGADSNFLACFWNSSFGAAQVSAVASSTTGLHTLSVGKISGLCVPLPPSSEQKRIVTAMMRLIESLERMGLATEDHRKKADAVRRAMLSTAFSGKLIPQNPADEPASALLERIHAERSGERAGPKSRRKEEPAYA